MTTPGTWQSQRSNLLAARLPAEMSAGPLPYNTQMEVARGQSWVIKTPPGGIPARSSYTPGRAICDSYIVDKNPTPPTLLEETNQQAATLNQYVYNLSTSSVPGGEWFIAVQVGDVLVVSSGGGGGGGATRVQFRSTTSMQNGLIDGEVILSEGGPAVGDTLTFHDPFNLFMSGEPYAIGWGYLRPAGEFCDLEEPRWEVEELSLPVNEAVGYTSGCIKKSNTEATITVNLNNSLDMWSEYHNVDPPPELGGSATSVVAANTFKLDTCANAKVRVRRVPDTVPSDSFNCGTPLGTSSSEVTWHIVQVEEQIARWLKVEWTGNEWVTAVQSGGRSLWDGCDPFVGCDVPPIVAPCGQPDCLPANTCGIAHYNPEAHQYEVTATQSSLLGAPTERLMPVAINEAGPLYPCETEVTQKMMCVFEGDEPEVTSRFKPSTVTIDVVTGAATTSHYIQLSTATIEVCSSTPGGDIAVDICPLLCACDQFYACCEAQCGCELSDCVWDYDDNSETWINTIPCPEGCNCSGSPPPGTPAPGDATTYTYPCEDEPSGEACCDSMSSATEVSFVDFQFQDTNFGDTTQGLLVAGTSLFSASGPCGATLTFSVEWTNLSCQVTQITAGTAVLKAAGTCCYWEVTLTQPTDICSDGFSSLGDGWPGNTILVPTCDGETTLACSSYPPGDDCLGGCSDGGFDQPTFTVTNIGDCNQ